MIKITEIENVKIEPESKICIVCNNNFYPKHFNEQICSLECRKIRSYERNKAFYRKKRSYYLKYAHDKYYSQNNKYNINIKKFHLFIKRELWILACNHFYVSHNLISEIISFKLKEREIKMNSVINVLKRCEFLKKFNKKTYKSKVYIPEKNKSK